MTDFLTLPARELSARIASRELSAETVAKALLARIEASEPAIQAWTHINPDQVLSQARELDAGPVRGPLHGLPIGVKDLMDTADAPTGYGSPIYRNHQPSIDAASVAAARQAGALIMGKTVTTEFATFQPGPTRNPRAPSHQPHTPGGSSSGSAAAVAAGMVPVAFGTQTAGSIVRPASYCGVAGYKPSFGTLPTAGVKPLSPSLDTIGALARHVDDTAFFIGALARMDLTPRPLGALRIGVCLNPIDTQASDDSLRAVEAAGRQLEQLGASVTALTLPPQCQGLNDIQVAIMGYEAAAAFAPESRTHASDFSPAFVEVLTDGRLISGEQFFAAQATAARARQALADVFSSLDLIIAPSAAGEAPSGLDATGDPMFNRMWSLLGTPCVHVPIGTGATGMPVGATLIGAMRDDLRTLSAAHALEASLA